MKVEVKEEAKVKVEIKEEDKEAHPWFGADDDDGAGGAFPTLTCCWFGADDDSAGGAFRC